MGYTRSDTSLASPSLSRRLTAPHRYIFSADGKYLLGGMMVGDTSDYVKLVALVRKKVRARLAPLETRASH